MGVLAAPTLKLLTMKIAEIIALAQDFCEPYYAQVYPTQDYYLSPNATQYGMPSRIPFPERQGVGCVFDANGDCMYVFIHTSWHNYFSGSKLATTKWSTVPIFIVSLILEDGQGEDLSSLANNLRQEIIRQAQPSDN